jgi:hypothetical protein
VNGSLRSPVRPNEAQSNALSQPTPPPDPAPSATSAPTAPRADNPDAALVNLRQRMKLTADEFAEGKINRAQFHALYARYSEQRSIIERLLERDPDTQAWRQVVALQGQTGLLRTSLEAMPLYYLVYKGESAVPLLIGGKRPANPQALTPLIRHVWTLPNRPPVGLGRMPFRNGRWLIIATGGHSATAVVFSLEPAIAQARLVRDLHADFERANQALLASGSAAAERMVFPQRALSEALY